MDTADLMSFIDRSPSPFHAVASVADMLANAGFVEFAEIDAWPEADGSPSRSFVRRGGSLVAWASVPDQDPLAGFRIVAAHTDSPNLRVKPNPDTGTSNIRQLGVEVYGGVLLNSWLDRDLGLSGRVAAVESGSGKVKQHLVLVDEPVLRVPQLAIHLDRDVNDSGLKLNRQRHMAPIWAAGPAEAGDFAGWIAPRVGVEPSQLRGWDLMAHDLTPCALLGADQAFLAAPRIDNLASCHAGTTALAAVGAELDNRDRAVKVLCLFDHEEVGSVSAGGAAGTLLPSVLARIYATVGGTAEDLPRALAASACISADGAHATHPNYADRHEPDHHIEMNSGPVIKRNSNARYATDAVGQALAEEACREAGVPFQLFVNRSDLACGSTIGPVTAAQLGITTVDMGVAQLSMHSAREMCGAADPQRLTAALEAFYGR